MSIKPWRQEIELLQNYGKHKTFTVETDGTAAINVVVLSGNMVITGTLSASVFNYENISIIYSGLIAINLYI